MHPRKAIAPTTRIRIGAAGDSSTALQITNIRIWLSRGRATKRNFSRRSRYTRAGWHRVLPSRKSIRNWLATTKRAESLPGRSGQAEHIQDGDTSRAAAARGTDGASDRRTCRIAKLPNRLFLRVEDWRVCSWGLSGTVAGVPRQVHPHGGRRGGRSGASHAGSGSVGRGDGAAKRKGQRPFLEPEKEPEERKETARV